jgi:hypothetical protein
VGHSFPAFRSKESTIHYLMVPASTLEKFTFEFISRIIIALVTLPLLYWLTFNLHGYFFQIFTDDIYETIGIQCLVTLDITSDYLYLIYSLITGAIFLALSLAFTGSAMFSKQPLVKSLFVVALVVMFFVAYSYIVVEHLGVGHYNPPEQMILLPMEEERVMKGFTFAFFASTAVMLFVAFRKLKEREV